MSHFVLIDDDPDFAAALAAQVRGAGHDITCAASCAEGLDLLSTMDEEHEVDAVLIDMFMPDADGFETITALRNVGLSAPLIAISAGRPASGNSVLNWAKALGADASLAKPFDVERLVGMINDMARQHKWIC